MKIINVNSKEYILEYTMEASLYRDCVEKTTGYMMKTSDKDRMASLEGIISSIGDLPQTALTMFYAGLMEHQSDEIKTEKEAKALLKQYFAEHKEEETGNFFGMMMLMIECMMDDGFFKQIGLEQMLEAPEKEVQAGKVTKIPQDHKKKQATKAGEK